MYQKCQHSQLLQQLQFALHLSSSVGIVAKPVDEDLEDRTPAVSVCYCATVRVCPTTVPVCVACTAAAPHTPSAGSSVGPLWF